MKELLIKFLPLLDILLLPIIYPAALLLKSIRMAGIKRLPNCKNALIKVGVFPILDHYYEPQFNYTISKQPFSQDRILSGIDWNVMGQLKLLSTFSFSQELSNLKFEKTDVLDFHFNNGAFESGDAEYWYQLIRSVKPKRIFEIGSGNSTLMAIKAINKNQEQDINYNCKHVCIEPYEMQWLEKTNVSIIRKKVEDVDVSFFSELEDNDILFIDSSHIIRPQGDVLFEYLELLPTLKSGVIVHVHDIFSPRNYLTKWLEDEVRLWNEQYLLEAFLSHNNTWEIIGALNYLQHNHHEKLKSVAPYLTPDREPGSFYLRKVA
jgi:Methyltransferase domain